MYSDIFIHTCKLGSFFFGGGVQNFKFQYFWGFSEKLIFLGYEDFVDIFGGHHTFLYNDSRAV